MLYTALLKSSQVTLIAGYQVNQGQPYYFDLQAAQHHDENELDSIEQIVQHDRAKNQNQRN